MVLRVPVCLDDILEKTLKKKEVTFINDLDYFNEADRALINSKIKDRIKREGVSLLPTCECGAITSEYDIGRICEECDEPVRHTMTDFTPDLWVRIPEGYGSWISPSFLKRFEMALRVTHRHLFRWIGDVNNNPSYKGTYVGDIDVFIAISKLPGFKRSYNFFRENIPLIIKTVIITSADPQSNKRLRDLLDYYNRFEDTIFSKHIPIISKRFLIIEEGNKGKFAFKEALTMGDMALNLMSAFNSNRNMGKSITVFLKDFADLKVDFENNVIGGKHGLFKENILGMRSIFTLRAVVSAIVGPHKNYEVRLPWGPLIVIMQTHLFNKMIRDGYNFNDMMNKWHAGVHNYDPVLDRYLKELRSESGGSFSGLLLRNPAQSNYGTNNLLCFEWKTDPADTTISLPTQMVVLGNGDMDGDEYLYILAIDKYMKECFENFKTQHTVAGNGPGKIFGKITATKTGNAIIGNRNNEERKALNI